MGTPRKKFSQMKRREGRGGRTFYFYNGQWRLPETIEAMRERGVARYRAQNAHRAAERVANARDYVEAAIQGARESKTMDEVADEAGVSRQWLYKQLAAAPKSAQAKYEQAREGHKSELIKNLCEHVAAGRSIAEIAQVEGVSQHVVYRRVVSLHEKYPSKAPSVEQIAQAHRRETARRLGELMREHQSYAGIAKEFGRSEVTIRKKYSRLRQEYPELMPGVREARRVGRNFPGQPGKTR